MDKINFENLPSTNTPISAGNLNKMQENIEKAINEVAIQDTGWIDLSPYINSNVVSIREGLTPMARKINNVVYFRGELYISTEPSSTIFNLLEGLPSYLNPTYQATGGGITYEHCIPYSIWAENDMVRVCIENKSVQAPHTGFDLCNIAPYIVD